jgi:RNA polymerase sigma-70 factor (ECF subfamily)
VARCQIQMNKSGKLRRSEGDGRIASSTHSPIELNNDIQSQFIQNSQRRVFLQIWRIVRNVHDAQDLTQETLFKAVQKRSQITDPAKSAQWLSIVAKNTARDFLRGSKRAALNASENVSNILGVAPISAETSVLNDERKRHLYTALKTLTERERKAVMMRDLAELPPSEVACQMQCTLATVRSHIANARSKLRKLIPR